MRNSQLQLLDLLVMPKHGLLTASLADLVGTDPFSFDGPGTDTLVLGVVSSKVAMLNQSPSGVAAVKVNNFVLLYHQPAIYIAYNLGEHTWHMIVGIKCPVRDRLSLRDLSLLKC